jgi:NHL repeat
MSQTNRARTALALASGAAFVLFAAVGYTQTMAPVNDRPNPYKSIENWAKLPDGRSWGSTSAVDIDRDGTTVWVAERCGHVGGPGQVRPDGVLACDGSNLDAVLKFDASGRLVKSFGAGLFVFPHGIHADREGNVWVVDGLGRGSKGHQIIKFTADGKELMRLGKPGRTGAGPDEFNAPSAIITNAAGELFVGDGHGGNSNARIMKFSKDGKLIKSWGKKGSGPGELDTPHALAMDSQGRLFVADRNNNRVQIFDQEGNYIADWKQFSRPSGVYIRNDVIYVADSESEISPGRNVGWKRGMRIGNAKTGEVTAFIPDPVEKVNTTSAAEGVAVDAQGSIFGAEVGPHRLMKYVKN